MKNPITVAINGDFAEIKSPKNHDFVNELKCCMKASWSASKGVWKIKSGFIDEARMVMRRTYGFDDLAVLKEEDFVDVKLTFTVRAYKTKAPVVVFGREIARAFGRDSRVTFSEDVAYINKCPYSGGTRNNWASMVPDGAVVKILAVHRNVLDEEELPMGCKLEVVKRGKAEIPESNDEAISEAVARIDAELAAYGLAEAQQ